MRPRASGPARASSLPDPTVSVAITSNGGRGGGGHWARGQSNAGHLISQEMPFPGSAKLRGEMRAGSRRRIRAVSRCGPTWSRGSKQAVPRTAPRHGAWRFVKRYQEVLRNILRISEARYAVGARRNRTSSRRRPSFSIFETPVAAVPAERRQQGDRDRRATQPARGGRIEVPEGFDGRADGNARGRCWRTRAPRRRRSSASRKWWIGIELAANWRAKLLPGLHVLGGYFNRAACLRCAVRDGFSKLPAWRGKQRAEVEEQGLHGEPRRRHDYEARTLESRRAFARDTVAATAGNADRLVRKIGDPGSAAGLGNLP